MHPRLLVGKIRVGCRVEVKRVLIGPDKKHAFCGIQSNAFTGHALPRLPVIVANEEAGLTRIISTLIRTDRRADPVCTLAVARVLEREDGIPVGKDFNIAVSQRIIGPLIAVIVDSASPDVIGDFCDDIAHVVLEALQPCCARLGPLRSVENVGCGDYQYDKNEEHKKHFDKRKTARVISKGWSCGVSLFCCLFHTSASYTAAQ